MNQLEFIKSATLGLLNRRGSSFTLESNGLRNNRRVSILMVAGHSTTDGNAIRITLEYGVDSDEAFFIKNEDTWNEEWKRVPKEEVSSYITELIETSSSRLTTFSDTDGVVDYYRLLTELKEDIFNSDIPFEINGWNHEIYLYEELGLEYSETTEAYHVSGGVGFLGSLAMSNFLDTCIEMGINPRDGKNYVGLMRSISNQEERVFEGTVKDFTNIVVEQYKNARNKKQ